MDQACDNVVDSTSVVDRNSNNSKLIDSAELDKMVQESLKEVNLEDDDGDLESDVELMRQLEEITGEHSKEFEEKLNTNISPNISKSSQNTAEALKQRIEMYKFAESNAKEAGESAKVRRLNRGLSMLHDLLKQITDGKEINKDEIPPEVTINVSKEVNTVDKIPNSGT